MIRIEGDRDALYQWDLNQRVILTGIKSGVQVHISDVGATAEPCPVVLAYDEGGKVYANIPNILLQKSGTIAVYIYVESKNEAHTEHRAEFLVLKKPKPSAYVYTETEILNYEALDRRLRKVETGNGAINGVPPGGKAGQLLYKKSDDDYDVEWRDFKVPEQYGLVTYDQDKKITIT